MGRDEIRRNQRQFGGLLGDDLRASENKHRGRQTCPDRGLGAFWRDQSAHPRLAAGPAQAEKDGILAELASRHRELIDALGLEQSERFEKHWSKLTELAATEGSRLAPGQRALLLAHGELLSSSIGQQALAAAGLEPVWQDARELLEAAPDSGG